MTEQPSSAAMELLSVILLSCGRAGICRLPPCACAESIDALCEQRVSAETERCARYHDERGRLVSRSSAYQQAWHEMAARDLRAPAERPAHPQQKSEADQLGKALCKLQGDYNAVVSALQEVMRYYPTSQDAFPQYAELVKLVPSALDSTGDTKEQTHRRYYDAFHAWFMQSGCDFWSECDAPESLATIAVELHDNTKAALASTGEQPATPPFDPVYAMTEHNVALAAEAYCHSRNSLGRHDSAMLHILEDALCERARICEQPIAEQPASPTTVVDYTERARDLRRKIREKYETEDPTRRSPVSRYALTEKQADELIATALSDVASDHQAEVAALKHDIERYRAKASPEATRERAIQDYRNAKAALLARLREPDVRQALLDIIYDVNMRPPEKADAALTKIVEMLA